MPIKITIPITDLYSRYWEGFRIVSSCVCHIRDMPHYRFAMAAIQLIIRGQLNQRPQATGYGRYTKWEAFCYGEEIHSVEAYFQNIRRWLLHPGYEHDVQAAPWDRGPLRLYYIVDGAHRAAFVAAYADTFTHSRPNIVIEVVDPVRDWPRPTNVVPIDFRAPYYWQMA